MLHRLINLPISGENTSIKAVDVFGENGKYFFIADADIDCDGSGGNPYGDPYFQPDTSYHYQGEALDPYVTPFMVLPSSVIKAVGPVVLGCQCRVTNLKNERSCLGLVGDVGPSNKLGEISCYMAERIGIDANPIYGGEDDYNAVFYEFWPGVPASVNGVIYPLQPF